MSNTLRVGVFGACGRMGSAVCEAVAGEAGLELVAAVDPPRAGQEVGPAGLVVSGTPAAMAEAGVEVAVDFTVAAAALANATWCAENGVHAVVGTSGLAPGDLARLGQLFEASTGANCLVAPNFAVGAVLMMRFAELAAPWFESVEIVELHHDGKIDAPSGTALLAAERISAARRVGAAMESDKGRPTLRAESSSAARGIEPVPGVRVHSVRLRGLVAHHEVLLGSAGQVLTIRHDSVDRSSFMPGVLLAVKEVPRLPGLTLGLESLLGL